MNFDNIHYIQNHLPVSVEEENAKEEGNDQQGAAHPCGDVHALLHRRRLSGGRRGEGGRLCRRLKLGQVHLPREKFSKK